MISGCTGDDHLNGRSGNDVLRCDDGKTDASHARDDDRLDEGTDGGAIRSDGGSDTTLGAAAEIDESFAWWAEWVDAV